VAKKFAKHGKKPRASKSKGALGRTK
jgi:hypothetical protein